MVLALYPKLMTLRIVIISMLLCGSFIVSGCAGKRTAADSKNQVTAQEMVDAAVLVLRENLDSPKKDELSRLLTRAKGVMIIPSMGDVSFLFSLGGGNSLMLVKDGDTWRGPVFFSRATGGIGMQAGVQNMSGILIYTHEEDVRYLLETGAVLQGRAAITLLSEDYEGNRTPEFFESGTVFFVGETSGLYAGMGVRSGGLSDRDSLNAAYHGVQDGDPEKILFEMNSAPAGSVHLRDLLDMAMHHGMALEQPQDEKAK